MVHRLLIFVVLLLTWLTSLALLAAFLARPAGAGPACAPWPQLREALAQGYSEQPAWIGLAGDTQVILALAPESGSWTLVAVAPTGLACVRGAGTSWAPIQPASPSASKKES